MATKKPLTPRQQRARARRRERLKGDLRDLVFRLCTAMGILLTMPWALSHAGTPRACDEPSACVGDQLVDVIAPILTRAGVGLFAGVLVAVVVCTTLPGLKRRDV